MDDKVTYLVQERQQETQDTATLRLTRKDRTIPEFTPGQFISVYFPELNTPEGKSYSISNPPGEKTLNITVKAIGEFSNRLCAMKPGDEVTGSLPYGFFSSELNDTDLVLIASGVGVTPFRSMILDSCTSTPGRKITLFQSARTQDELLFKKDFANRTNVSVSYFVTRDSTPHPSAVLRRMCVDDILHKTPSPKMEYLICGSISFVRDLWRGLKENGVREDQIYTEAFFSH